MEVPGDTEASLVLYRKGAAEPEIRASFYRGVSHRQDVCDAGNRVETGTIEYNFRIDGKIVQDPFACVIRGREKFGAPLSKDEHEVRCAFLSEKEYDWEGDTAPEDSVQ